jgi:hypothetical protein
LKACREFLNVSHFRAFEALTRSGFDPTSAANILSSLEAAGLALADRTHGEFVCRWVDVRERAVPPDADTIIRTLTRTAGERSTSNTHWLEGIVPPPSPPDPA